MGPEIRSATESRLCWLLQDPGMGVSNSFLVFRPDFTSSAFILGGVCRHGVLQELGSPQGYAFGSAHILLTFTLQQKRERI